MSYYQSNLIEDKGLVKVFDCKLSGFEIGKATEERLQEIQSTAHLKGFRKGKAPMNVIQNAYFGKTFFDVVNKRANECITDIAEKNSFKLASSPKVDIDTKANMPAQNDTANIKDIAMQITYELLPEITDVDLSKINIDKYTLEVSEEDVISEIKRLSKRHATKEEKSDPIKSGDIAVIDCTGYKDGVEFEATKVTNHELEIGSKSFIEGFEDGLIDAKAGEEKTLQLTFPEEYPHKELAGQPVEFKVQVLKVFTQVLPEINDDLAKKFGFDTLEDFKKDVNKAFIEHYENTYREKQKDVIFKGLSPLLTFDVPPSLLPKAEENKDEEQQDDSKDNTKDKEEVKLQSVRLSLFLMNYATKHEIKVEKQDFMTYIATMAQMYGQSPRAIFDLYDKNPKMKESVYNLIFENKIYEAVYNDIPADVKVISKQEFDDILK